jgi:hypothetical protein
MRLKPLIALLPGLLLAACAARIPFQQDLRSQYSLGDEQLLALQYYTSGQILLMRKLPQRGRDIVRGQLRVISGQHYDEVLIPAGTPGVVVAADHHSVHVSFDPQSTASLQFGALHGSEARGPYQLYGFWDEQRRNGIVLFDGVEYEAPIACADVYLAVDLYGLENLQSQRRVLPGRRVVDERPPE